MRRRGMSAEAIEAELLEENKRCLPLANDEYAASVRASLSTRLGRPTRNQIQIPKSTAAMRTVWSTLARWSVTRLVPDKVIGFNMRWGPLSGGFAYNF
jgi:hypothetical protein